MDAALLQETCCWDTSCSTEAGTVPTGHMRAIRNDICCLFLQSLEGHFIVTCSDDADISPQDLAAVQHDFFQLWGKEQDVLEVRFR